MRTDVSQAAHNKPLFLSTEPSFKSSLTNTYVTLYYAYFTFKMQIDVLPTELEFASGWSI